MTAPIPPATRAQIAAAYARGETSSNLARQHGVASHPAGPPPNPENAYTGGWYRTGAVWRPKVTGKEAS